MKNIVLPASLLHIGNYAFNGCNFLKLYSSNPLYVIIDSNILIDNGSKTIISCFGNINKIVIPSYIKKIGEGSFYNCESLNKVILSKSLKDISDNAFNLCISLQEIIIPDTIEYIGDWAFNRCDKLKKIVIPSSVTRIGIGAFAACYSLEEIYFPTSVINIGDTALFYCKSLQSIFVPKGQTERFRELLKNAGCDLSIIKEQDE